MVEVKTAVLRYAMELRKPDTVDVIEKTPFFSRDSTKFNGVSLFTSCFVPDNQEESYLYVF